MAARTRSARRRRFTSATFEGRGHARRRHRPIARGLAGKRANGGPREGRATDGQPEAALEGRARPASQWKARSGRGSGAGQWQASGAANGARRRPAGAGYKGEAAPRPRACPCSSRPPPSAMAGLRALLPLFLWAPLLLPLLPLPARAAAQEEEDGVLVLRASSFEQALADHRYLLVEFCERGGAGPGGTEGSGRAGALRVGLPRAGVGLSWAGARGLRGPPGPARGSGSPSGPRSAREWSRGGPAGADAPSRRRPVVRTLQGAGARVREGGGEAEGGGLGNPAGQGGRHGGVGPGAAVRRTRVSHHQVLQERRQSRAQGVHG